MYIKSIVLDGFKSYGNRVEVTGFDPEFNAITGLNGTGKSNILDSICFVLGITNLSNVRAGSLQELIYKHGQAGITKATVSITFDNRDKRQCPIGYENHDEITVTRQVVMGGKNKYLINGLNVQNKRVSDLFCSVQLNVNNPHFLIMQGRITKVLNMKPAEILSMVEEAAGTRMYEAKKQAAEKTIERKDAKLRELNDIIREDIAPKLQRLQDERSQYQEHQKVIRELENLTRLHVAWNYVTAEVNVKESANRVTAVQEEVKNKKENIKDNEREAKEFDKKITELHKKLDEESGSLLRELEEEVQEAEKAEAAVSSAARGAKDAAAAEDARARLMRRALADDRAALADKSAQLQQVSSTFESLKSASETSEAVLAEAQQRFLAVSSGLEGASESLQDQLIVAKQEASEASTRISQSMIEKRHAEERLKILECEYKGISMQYERDRASIDKHQAEVDKLRTKLTASGFNEVRYSELRQQVSVLDSTLRDKRNRCDALSSRIQGANFRYTPPPNFDERCVFGPVCRLINVIDPADNLALEVTAGGRLYNVVVDTEVSSRRLLKEGRFENRITTIPLDQISGNPLDTKTLRLAQKIGGGADKVRLALDLVTFDSRLRPAMEWVLGRTLVCYDLDVGKRVTFHPQVRTRSVTLEGDVFDPAGTVTGGARKKEESPLNKLAELKSVEQEIQQMEEELAQCNRELNSLHRVSEEYAALKQKLEMSTHTLTVARERFETSATAQLDAEIKALRKQIEDLVAAVERDKKTQSETAARARELEDQVKDITGHREREFKKAENNLKKAKEDAEKFSSSWKQREQDFETLKLEVQELEKAVAAGETQLQSMDEASSGLQRELATAQREHAAATEKVKEIQGRIKKQKSEIASRNGDIARLQQQKEKLGRNNADLELQLKELDYRVKELQTEAAECEKRIKTLEKDNPWIPGEREYFGAVGGLYDFEGRQASVAGARLVQLRERRDRLARGLNTRAHALLGKEEEQYQDLMNKKKIVEADRAKLVQVMAELDEKKRHTLTTACEQVTRDFGSIFSSLLPGAQAKLQPPPGRGVLDGLEVKVGFNGTWKDSLGELSGGQRSLVALSLVLAMLLFKPAPLYILDEVDAALDLSHTQNIGQMLRNHFHHSQFIIVSLKDGMFNNANVLFRTRFVDGMSSVQRTVNQPRTANKPKNATQQRTPHLA